MFVGNVKLSQVEDVVCNWHISDDDTIKRFDLRYLSMYYIIAILVLIVGAILNDITRRNGRP